MAKNSLNLIQVENTREGIEKLADLLLVATENITYMQYKLSSQMFGGNSDVIEIRFGDCVEYVSRIIMEADARRRDELLQIFLDIFPYSFLLSFFAHRRCLGVIPM